MKVSGGWKNSRVELEKLSGKRAETSLGAADTSVCATNLIPKVTYVNAYRGIACATHDLAPVWSPLDALVTPLASVITPKPVGSELLTQSHDPFSPARGAGIYSTITR